MMSKQKQQNIAPNKFTFHGHGHPEPIGLEYIAGAVASSGFICQFKGNWELEVSLPDQQPKLILLSAITSDFHQILQAAHHARERGNLTVLGGYHACGCYNDLIDSPFDYIVIGEGEEVVIAIAKARLLGVWDDLDSYEVKNVGLTKIVRANRVEKLDSLPIPLRSEQRLSQYRIHDLMWPPPSLQQNPALILGSRGCVHNCDFCASSTVWGHGVRLRSPENVVGELQDLQTRFDTNTVVFIDQSLGQIKKWSIDLCNAIKNNVKGMHWYHQSNLTVDRDVIRAMAEAGCKKIGFGIEGVSPDAISRIKPVNPINYDTINELCDFCNALGIFVKAYLIIGFPWETEDTVDEYLMWIQKLRVNQVKISYFTPFPGSRAWEQYSNQLVTTDWSDFDTVKMPVVRNPNISVERYHEIRNLLFKAFYGSPSYADVTSKILRLYPHYVQSYKEFTVFLQHFDMINGDEIWLEWLNQNQAGEIRLVAKH
ncbi:MAG: B12-binding domain-containing radical SAM protein [Desulfobacteraceae bacterium]|nr:B12-binding domain-containing radical SAM protein [Desulfobacteraceae bacterium]